MIRFEKRVGTFARWDGSVITILFCDRSVKNCLGATHSNKAALSVFAQHRRQYGYVVLLMNSLNEYTVFIYSILVW